MGKRLLISFAILVSFQSYSTAQSRVEFIEEHIDFLLDQKNFTINGIFSFSNVSNEVVNQRIIFPFAVSADLIDSVRVINLRDSKIIHYSCLPGSISFEILLFPKDTIDLNIYYSQKASNINSYILTTTRFWGKPLKKAVYSLTVSNDTDIRSMSYKPDSLQKSGDEIIYYWVKRDFLPDKDFDILINEIK
jgi:hypothetical protein